MTVMKSSLLTSLDRNYRIEERTTQNRGVDPVHCPTVCADGEAELRAIRNLTAETASPCIFATTGKARLHWGNRRSAFVPRLAKPGFNAETGSSRICATPGKARLQWGRDRVSGFTSRLHAVGEPKDGLHPQHGTPKPCRVRRQLLRRRSDQHSRPPLAQFGLTPKSKRGLASSDPGEAV